jgi:hypothetical protein
MLPRIIGRPADKPAPISSNLMCPPHPAPWQVAHRLGRRLHDTLRSQPSLFSDSANFQRPVRCSLFGIGGWAPLEVWGIILAFRCIGDVSASHQRG